MVMTFSRSAVELDLDGHRSGGESGLGGGRKADFEAAAVPSPPELGVASGKRDPARVRGWTVGSGRQRT
jgi:hypothetical protein